MKYPPSRVIVRTLVLSKPISFVIALTSASESTVLLKSCERLLVGNHAAFFLFELVLRFMQVEKIPVVIEIGILCSLVNLFSQLDDMGEGKRAKLKVFYLFSSCAISLLMDCLASPVTPIVKMSLLYEDDKISS